MPSSRAGQLLLVLMLPSALSACGAGASASGPAPGAHPRPAAARPAATGTPRPWKRAVMVLGRSAQGRPIDVWVRGDSTARRRILVIGCIHGNETAGIGVARELIAGQTVARATLWVVSDLNPDGVAADTRQNAHGVDLNRNFPYAWRRLGVRGDQQFSGPGPLSEPESRIAQRLILRLRPAITIWFHQPEAVTDESGGSTRIERHFAVLSGLALRRLPRYPGSATSWQNHRFPGTTAFVVELPAGRPSAAAVRRYAGAVRAVAASP